MRHRAAAPGVLAAEQDVPWPSSGSGRPGSGAAAHPTEQQQSPCQAQRAQNSSVFCRALGGCLLIIDFNVKIMV